MFPDPVDLAFRRFQRRACGRALAFVFDRTAPELLAVARHLATPEAPAEDLVQSTFVVAMQAAASHEQGRAVLPWLLGILANQARLARRRAKRAVDPARIAADAGVDAADAAAANELRAELQAAIERLPEVYRPVLRLVLAHGLSPHEIAAALERPAGTVRAQLSRGLDLLRRVVPRGLAAGAAVAAEARGGRGLRDVRAAVLAQVPATAFSVATNAALGGWIVLQHKLLAAATVLVAVGLGWLWLSASPPPGPLATAHDAGAATVATAALPSAGEPPAREGREVREDAPVPAAADPAPAPPPAAAAADSTGALCVRVRANGSPVPGIGVALRPGQATRIACAWPEFVRTDARGEVTFRGLAAGGVHVWFDRAEGAFAYVQPGTTTEHEVELRRGVRVRGQVLDAAGQPVPGARVVAVGARLGATILAEADRAGAFAVEHVWVGVDLQATAPQHAPSPAQAVHGEPGAECTMQLRLRAGGCRLAGCVRDAKGTAVPRAIVAVLPAAAAALRPPERNALHAVWLRTDAEGRFATDEIGSERVVVTAQPDDDESPPCWRAIDPAVEPFVELRVRRGGVVTGRVLRDGQPAAVAIVTWCGETAIDTGYLANLLGMRQTFTGDDGRFRMAGLLPGAVQIRAIASGQTLQQDTLLVRADGPCEWDVDLSAASGMRIDVDPPQAAEDHRLWAYVCTTGAPPTEGPALVRLHDLAGDAARWNGTRAGTVDVVLTTMHARDVVQLAVQRGIAATTKQIAFSLRPEDLPRQWIRGRLVDSQQAPIAGVTVGAWRTDAPGLVVQCTGVTGADGSFALGPLPAGTYDVWCGEAAQRRPLQQCLVTAGRDEDLGPVRGGS
jgi:RNA polymerase sigma factor (sigma-70 family)